MTEPAAPEPAATEPAATEPQATEPRRIEQSRMRRAVGRQMTVSKQTVPHFYVSTEIEVDRLLDVIGEVSSGLARPRVSVTVGLVRALTETLLEHPLFNATATDDGFVIGDSVNMGIAIALEGGLVAPALLDCQKMDLIETARALDDLVARTRAGRLRAAEMGSATFTLSNLGMFDVTSFSAIVIPPQVAILAAGRAVKRPVVVGDAVEIRTIMTATLSADHRAADGAEAARFLTSLKARIEGFQA